MTFVGLSVIFGFIKADLRNSTFPNPGLLLLIAWNEIICLEHLLEE